MSANDRIIIFDTTLRDGEQSPGATMNLSEKIYMAQQLETLGVDIIEAGFAASSPGDFEAVATVSKELSKATVCSLARSMPQDIDKAAEALRHANKSRIHIFLATSALHMEYKLRKTPEQVLRMAEDAVRHAAATGADIEFSCEDASRSEMDFLVEVCNTAIGAGARTLNIPDTVGYAVPDEYGQFIKTLISRVRKDIPVIFSIHCHNDLGLGVANTLAALSAGARQAEVTVGGIGERAGNAALEELAMALQVRKNYFKLETNIDHKQIYPTVKRLYRVIGQPIARNKPIVGANAFAHESGIHQAGVLANPETYEIMTPESVGVPGNAIVLGKHSGRNAIKAKLEELGYTLDDDNVTLVCDKVKQLADMKQEIFDEDLEAVVLEKIYRIPITNKYSLIHLAINSSSVTSSDDSNIPPVAMVVMEVNGERHEHAHFGKGPVDAVFKAINHVTNTEPKLENYFVNAITGGSDAQGQVTVRLALGETTATGRGADPDIINASALAYMDALNRIARKKQEDK